MVQYALMLVLTVPAALGLPPVVTQALTLCGIGYAFWLEWFVARHALGVTGGKAAALVGLDLALGLFLAGMIRTLSGG
jgi:predicted Kef-type K+ transport protein